LNENDGFPSVVGKPLFPARVDIIPRPVNHAFDFLFTHFSIFEYPGDTQKIHGRKTKQDVEVNLTVLTIKNWAFLTDLLGIKSSHCRSHVHH
jgi:hypothetical protein